MTSARRFNKTRYWPALQIRCPALFIVVRTAAKPAIASSWAGHTNEAATDAAEQTHLRNHLQEHMQEQLQEQLQEHFPEIVLRGAARLNPRLKQYYQGFPRDFTHYGGYYTMTEENWPLIGNTTLRATPLPSPCLVSVQWQPARPVNWPHYTLPVAPSRTTLTRYHCSARTTPA